MNGRYLPPGGREAEVNVKLNIGCGTDYREGFVNVDGSGVLHRVDRVVNLSTERLCDHFDKGTCEFILAQDVVEHHAHWEAVRLMREFYELLMPGGRVQIRVPDAQYIIETSRLGIDQKLNLLFGGQDLPQGQDVEMDASRKVHPEFFCHKYGWTMESMGRELKQIGFRDVKAERAGTNFVVGAKK